MVCESIGRSRFIPEEKVGVSDALDYCGQGDVLITTKYDEYGGEPAKLETDVGSRSIPPGYWSEKYQWLPSNVGFREDGSAQIKSYINGLHPTKYPEIYKAVEDAIDTAIAAWDICLTEMVEGIPRYYAGRGTSRLEEPRGRRYVPSYYRTFEIGFYFATYERFLKVTLRTFC